MGLWSRLLLLATDDTLHSLASAVFMRMLRREPGARIPDFAGQRVRQASLIVELAGGRPSRIVRSTFSILVIDRDGSMDVERFNAQQLARVGGALELGQPARRTRGQIVEAASQFVVQGGSWEPSVLLMGQLEAAALGQLSCQRVRVVR